MTEVAARLAVCVLAGGPAALLEIEAFSAGYAPPLELVAARAVRENAVILTFSAPILYTRTLEPGDASERRHFTFEIVSGENTRSIAAAAVNPVEGDGTELEVVLDRKMSGAPTVYRAKVQGVAALAGGLVDSGSSAEFLGLARFESPPLPDLVAPTRDIANPQTHSALLDPLPVTTDPNILGTIPVDETGDVAFDEGRTNTVKRCIRRLTTRKNSFAHLPGYGVTFLDSVKHLARPGTLQSLAAEAEEQCLQEPDVLEARVAFVQRPGGITFYRVRIRTSTSTFDFDAPVNVEDR